MYNSPHDLRAGRDHVSGENRIDYIEMPAREPAVAKRFFTELFGWTFEDYGPDYVAFSESGLEGGFRSIEEGEDLMNGALVILYHENLSEIKDQVVKAGGKIVQEIFSFPGGRRFHFADPSGNELAIWSDK